MPKKKNRSEDADIKRFEKFVKKVLGKEDAKVFFKNNDLWADKIEKDEPELEKFVLMAIEFDNAACAVFLMDDWMKRMNRAENYKKWTKNTPQIKKRILDDVYFQIKTNVFRTNMEKFGGRKGVTDRLLEVNRELGKKNYEGASKLARPLLEILDYNPFISNDLYHYVSICDKMEYSVSKQSESNTLTRNINSICPIEHILLQNGLIAFEMKKYSEAEQFLIEALKWNPVSVNGLKCLSSVYLEQNKWKKCMTTVIRGLECAYRPSDLKTLYGTLMAYFYCKNLYKDALCCNYLKMQYASSDKQRINIGRDFQFISKSDEWMKKQMRKICANYIRPLETPFDEQRKDVDRKVNKRINVTKEDIYESSEKYGYPIGANPNIFAIAKKCRENAIRAKNKEDVEYFTSVLSNLEKCRFNTDKLMLKMSRHKSLNAVN